MRALLICVLLTIFCMTVLVAAAVPKDLARVSPGKGDLPGVTWSTQICRSEVTIKQRKQRTVARKLLWDCHHLPAWLQPSLRVSWSNVFRELQRARDCGVPAFTYARCRG